MSLARRAEDMVTAYLERQGHQILGRNVRLGPKEVDIIARRGRVVVFCEVRARRGAGARAALESVDRRKARHLWDAARLWLHKTTHRRCALRLDIAAVIFDESTDDGEIHYVRSAIDGFIIEAFDTPRWR